VHGKATCSNKCTQAFSRINLFFADDAQAELDSVEAELETVELQISELLEKQTKLNSRKNKLLQILEGACSSAQPSGSNKPPKPSLSKQDLQHYEESGITHSQLSQLK